MTPHHDQATDADSGEHGFTLIELLVVITILGILAAVVVFAVGGLGDKGKDEAKAADAKVLRTALEAHCARASDGRRNNPGGYGTISELHDERLLAGSKPADPLEDTTPAGNKLQLDNMGTCGSGPKSSFTIYDPDAEVDIINPGLTMGGSVVDVAVNTTTNRVYVSVATASTREVVVVDGGDTVVDRIQTPGVSGFGEIVVSAKTDKVYRSMGNGYAVIDGDDPVNADGNPATNAVKDVAATVEHAPGDSNTDEALDPATGDLYVLVKGHGAIDIIDGDDDTVRTVSFPAGFTATSSAINIDADLRKAFIAGSKAGFQNQIAVLDLSGSDPPSLIQLGPDGNADPGPAGANQGEITEFSNIVPIASAGTAGKLYLGATMKNPRTKVAVRGVYDLASGGFTTSLKADIPGNPELLGAPVVNPSTKMVYFQGDPQDPPPATIYGSAIWRFNVQEERFDRKADTEASIEFGGELSVNPNNNRVYMQQRLAQPGSADTSRGGLVVLDGDTMNPTTIEQGRRFRRIAVNTNPLSNKVYAIDNTTADGKLMIFR